MIILTIQIKRNFNCFLLHATGMQECHGDELLVFRNLIDVGAYWWGCDYLGTPINNQNNAAEMRLVKLTRQNSLTILKEFYT